MFILKSQDAQVRKKKSILHRIEPQFPTSRNSLMKVSAHEYVMLSAAL